MGFQLRIEELQKHHKKLVREFIFNFSLVVVFMNIVLEVLFHLGVGAS